MSVLGSADILLWCCEYRRWKLELEELEAEPNRPFAQKVNNRSALATLSLYQSSPDLERFGGVSHLAHCFRTRTSCLDVGSKAG